mgnify:CR=1 FL=1
MNLLRKGSIFHYLGSTNGAVTAATISIIILCIIIVVNITGLNIFQILMRVIGMISKTFSGFINRRETNYHRDLEIGKINEKRNRVKIYRFLNDLTIDLGLKQQGATPYEFLFIVSILTAVGNIILTQLLFGSVVMAFLLFPIVLCGVICVLYTRANIAHDRRIEAIIEAENIICNNITAGVLVAVKNSINVIPSEVRGEFRDFVDNVESKNFHIRTALLELNNNLGSVADDFIKKCIVFETEEEHGIAGMFKDIVEVNNIKMEMRIEMKRRFEEVRHSFIIGAAMIFIFLGGVIGIFEDVRAFYFNTPLGQIIIAIDLLLLIVEFVYITYLRAQEL